MVKPQNHQSFVITTAFCREYGGRRTGADLLFIVRGRLFANIYKFIHCLSCYFNGLAISTTGTIPVATKTTTSTNSNLAVVTSSPAIGYDAIAANSTKMIFLSTGSTDNSAAVACDLNLNFTGRTAGSLSFNYANILNRAVSSPNGRSSSLIVY